MAQRISRSCILSILTALALAATVAAASEPPPLSPLVNLSGDSTNGLAAFDQFEPNIARGGNGYLVVWTDSRTDAGRKVGSQYSGNGSDIYAARLDSAGKLLDVTPIPVAQSPAEQMRPQAAWNGQNWLVVWLSQEPTEFYYADRVMAARVSPAGAVLDAPIPVSPFGADVNEFAVSSDGSQWAVVWQGGSAGSADLRGARVSAAGQVVDAGGVQILPEEYYVRSNLDLAFSGDEYLLIWQGLDAVQGKRLKPDLSPIDASYFNISNEDFNLSNAHVASNGTDFFAVWEASVSSTYYEGIHGARVNHAGQVLDPNGIVIWKDYSGFTGRSPRVAWGGDNWHVSFLLNGITILRVNTQGKVIDPNAIPIDFSNTSNKWEPDSAPAFGGGIQLAWRDTRAGGPFPMDIYAAPASATRVIGAESRLSNGQPAQIAPNIAPDSSGYMIAFRSDVSGERRVKAQRVDADGNSLWAETVTVAASATIDEVDVAWNGALYLVVWNDTASDEIMGRRIRPDGAFADTAPFVVMRGQEPEVSAIGDTFLVVGTHAPTYWQYRFSFAVRVQGASGAVLGSPVQLGNLFAKNPDVAAFSNRWLAVWERHPSHDDPTAEINGNFINTDGTVGTEFVIRSDWYTVRYHYNPTIATDGATAWVAWEDPRAGNANWNLYGRRVQSNGTLLDSNTGLALVTAPKNQRRASVAWDGAQFLLIYEDERNNALFYDPSTDVYATRVSAAGAVMDADGFAVFNDAMPSIFPDAGGANGRGIFAASLYRNTAPPMAYRIGLRAVGETPLAVVIGIDGQDIVLTWQMPENATSCEVWRATTPYFNPGDATAILAETLSPCNMGAKSWRDPGRSGDASVNYTYRVRPVGAGQSAVSIPDGEFDYNLIKP